MTANPQLVIARGRRYWQLATSDLYLNVPAQIDWATLIPAGIGRRRERSHLISAFKLALMAVESAPRRTGGLQHATLIQIFGRMRSLAHWLTTNGIWRLSEITPDQSLRYLAQLRARRGHQAVTRQTMRRHIAVFQILWAARNDMPDHLQFDIDRLQSTIDARFHFRQPGSWRPLAEQEAIRLIHAALESARQHSVYVGKLIARLWQQQREVVGLSQHQARKRRLAFFAGLSDEPEFIKLRTQLRIESAHAYTALCKAAAILEGACLVVLLFMVGLRAREVVRLDVNCVSSEGEAGGDGSLILRGLAAKRGGRPRHWAITPQVADAVEMLKEMLRTPRELANEASLFVLRSGRCSVFPRVGRNAKRADPSAVTQRLRAFAASAFPGNADLVRRIHAHAARKTFARFVVLRDKRALESLAYHFGHTHRAITDGYYVGSDMELAVLLEAENRDDLAESLTDLLTPSEIAGKAGLVLEAERKLAASFRGKLSLKSTVDRLIDQGVQLAPCDWGYCVYSKPLSACHGDDKGPNERQRSPEICSTCPNFAVTQKHRAWWEQRVSRDEAFLASQALSSQTATIVRRRLAKSADLLRQLNVAAGPARRSDGERQED